MLRVGWPKGLGFAAGLDGWPNGLAVVDWGVAVAAEPGADENGLLFGVDRAPEDEPGRGFRKGEALMAVPFPLNPRVLDDDEARARVSLGRV